MVVVEKKEGADGLDSPSGQGQRSRDRACNTRRKDWLRNPRREMFRASLRLAAALKDSKLGEVEGGRSADGVRWHTFVSFTRAECG